MLFSKKIYNYIKIIVYIILYNSTKNIIFLEKYIYLTGNKFKIFKIKFFNKFFYTYSFLKMINAIKRFSKDTFLIHELYKNFGYPDLVIDVGSNIGYWALSNNFVLKKSQILCFEPVNENFKLLEKNTKDFSNIKIFNIGIDQQPGYAQVSLPDDNKNNYGCFSMVINSSNIKKKIKLDNFNNYHGYFKNKKLIYLKIDAEGNEYNILKSAQILFKMKIFISLEFNEKINKINNYIEKSVGLLSKNNFKPYYFSINKNEKRLGYLKNNFENIYRIDITNNNQFNNSDIVGDFYFSNYL